MLRRAGIGLALRAPRLGPCTQPRTGRFRWWVAASTRPSGVEGPKKVRSAPFEAVTNSVNFFRPSPRPRPFRVLLKPCSPQLGEDQQPTSGADMSATGPGTEHPRCTRHPRVTLMVHPRRWGWVYPRCRAAGQSTPQPYPFVPLPLVRPTQAVAAELEIRPVRRSAPVPSPEAKRAPLGRITNASVLVSSGSRLPAEAGRLFTRQRPPRSGSGAEVPRLASALPCPAGRSVPVAEDRSA